MNWIKTSDSMPPYDEKVLVYYKCPDDEMDHEHRLDEHCSEIYLGAYSQADLTIKEWYQNSSKELYDQWSWCYKDHWSVPDLSWPERDSAKADPITHWASIEKPNY